MVYTALVFVYRKPGISTAEFKDLFERNHVPLIKSIAGPFQPLIYARRYIERSGPNEDAKVIVGTQADFEYDLIVELVWADEGAFGGFTGLLHEEENAAKIEADELVWADRTKTKLIIIGETITS